VPPLAADVQTLNSGQSCNQKAHPEALIIDTIITPATFGIAVRDDGLTYFTELFNGGVGITSTQTRTVDGFIPTGDIPTGLAFSPDGFTAYVTNQSSQDVGVIDVASAQQVATIFTPAGNPSVVRVSPDGSRLFIGTTSTTVYIVDTQTRQIIGTVQTGSVPNGFDVAPDGRIAYASASQGGTVTEFDMFSGEVLRTFVVGGVPQDLAVTKSGKFLYVGNEAGYLNEIDLQTGQVTANIPLVGGAFGIGVTPDDVQAYVGIPNAGVVQVFNLQSHHLAQTINVGGNPRRIAFSQQGHIGAVANLNGYITLVR
jgi:YVTN family beta-propeller protein